MGAAKFYIISLFAIVFALQASDSYAANAILTWVSEPEQGLTQVNVQRMKNDDWQPVEAIYQSRERNYAPSVGSNALGHIIVVWSATSTVRSITRSMLFFNDQWQSNVILSNQGGETTTPAIIFDQNNDAMVAWVSDHNGLDDVYVRQWRSNTNRWTEAEKVNLDNEVPDIFPTLSLDLNGNVVVQWQSISRESDAYVEVSRVYDIVPSAKQEELSQTELSGEHRELRYADVGMPPNWQGAVGRAVMHYPDNKSVLYDKLPRHLGR